MAGTSSLDGPHDLGDLPAAGLGVGVLYHHASELEPVSLGEIRERVVGGDELAVLLRYLPRPLLDVAVEFVELCQILPGVLAVGLLAFRVGLDQGVPDALYVVPGVLHVQPEVRVASRVGVTVRLLRMLSTGMLSTGVLPARVFRLRVISTRVLLTPAFYGLQAVRELYYGLVLPRRRSR